MAVHHKYPVSMAKTFSVINDLADIAKQLPRMPTAESYAYLKSSTSAKSKQCLYRPSYVKEALEWLKINNIHIRKIPLTYPSDWNDAAAEIELEEEEIDDGDCEALEKSFNEPVSTNNGTDMQMNEVFFSNGDELKDQFSQLRENLGIPVMVRGKGDYAHPHTTPYFYILAFPQIYPYGVGDYSFSNSSKYVKHTLEIGGSRDFQKVPSYIFSRYYFEMQRKIGGVSTVATKNCNEESVLSPNSSNDITVGDLLAVMNSNVIQSTRESMFNFDSINHRTRMEEVITRLLASC
jgi:hypothetical protein